MWLLQMEYSLSTSVSNVHAMYQPTFSISSVGIVPNRRSGMQTTDDGVEDIGNGD